MNCAAAPILTLLDIERVRLRNTPFWQDYRIQAALLLVLTAAIVFIFR
jgi:hypothetical protein